MTRSPRAAIVLGLALAGCALEAPSVASVSPRRVGVDELPTEVTVGGESLRAMARISLSNSSRAAVVPLRAQLGARDVRVLRHPSPERLVLEVPTGLEVGAYDLTLETPGGKRLVVPDALLVTDSAAFSGSETWSGDSTSSPDPSTSCVGLEFEPPEQLSVVGLDSTSLWSPTFGSDPSAMYFAATVDGRESLWRARRVGDSTTFVEPTRVATRFGEVDVGTPFVNAAATTLYVFAVGPDTLGERDLYALSGSGVTFDVTQHLVALNGGRRDHLPWVSPDETWLVFVSDRAGNGEDYWSATRSTKDADFEAPTPLTSLNSSSNEGRIYITADGRAAVFSSNRPGSLGSYDLWSATRATADGDFDDVRNLSPLNSEGRDFDVSLTPDERELFFTRELGAERVLLRARRRCSF